MDDAGKQRDPGRHNGDELSSAGPERRRSRRDSQKKRKSSRDSKKLQRDPRRTYSFSPGRNDTIRVEKDPNRPPVPPLPANLKGKGVKSDKERPQSTPVGKKPLRASTQPPESTQDIERMPTLHKRSAQEIARRKSSKKRKEEHNREAEIKAMVAFMPTRPAVDANSSGRPMKRESKKMHGGLNRNLQNPSSDISLPMAESINSSLSGMSDHQTSYKLSAFDMLSPRPTIRYSENPRYGPGPSGYGSDRSESKKKRASERVPIPEETLKANKRIDDLADDLTAGELRELMERDQKRREKKKIADKIKMERRIAGRQEKQTADEAAATRDGTPPPVNMERGVLGREVVGLGIGTSATVTNKRKGSTGSESGREKRPTEKSRQDSISSAHNPHNNFQRSASLATDTLTPASEHSNPVIETATVGTVAKASISPTLPPKGKGHTRGASSISQIMDLPKAEIVPQRKQQPTPESVRESSESSVRAPQSWKSFFKRPKNKRSSTPSSFSNTSRDSMQNGQGPQIGYTPVRSTSNIPKRTMSKFREDLPELPMSPPDSRVQSPEADFVPPIRRDYAEKRVGNRISSDDPRVRYDTPTSGYRSIDAMRLRDETPTSGHRSVDAPSPEPAAALSQSLASIDSEGSWLSGRKGGSKRGSAQAPVHPLRDSASSLQKRYKDFSESAEELGIAEDEYFSRLSPEPEEENRLRRASANPLPSSDEDDGGSIATSPVSTEPSQTKWGAVARHPTVVHREPRAKSREGLLNEFEYDSESEQAASSPERRRKSYGFNKEVIDEAEPGIYRASSVDLGRGHVRHISAGSARLLDLKPRASGEGRRLSQG
jgi:hypothetical protein